MTMVARVLGVNRYSTQIRLGLTFKSRVSFDSPIPQRRKGGIRFRVPTRLCPRLRGHFRGEGVCTRGTPVSVPLQYTAFSYSAHSEDPGHSHPTLGWV